MDRHASRRKFKAVFDEWVAGKSCAICGENRRACLERHHRNPDAKAFFTADFINSAKFTPENERKLRKELAKCEVLCGICHRRLHGLGRPNLQKQRCTEYAEIWWELSGRQAVCEDCGHKFERLDVDFHHRDPAQKVAALSALMQLSPVSAKPGRRMSLQKAAERQELNRKKVLDEMAKCDILCVNCHKLRHEVAPQGGK